MICEFVYLTSQILMWSYIDVSIVFGSSIVTTAIYRMRFNKSLLQKKLFFVLFFVFYFILFCYFILFFVLFYFILFCFLFFILFYFILFFVFLIFFSVGGGTLVSHAVMVEVLWILMCKPKECFRWHINLIFVAP